MTVVRDFERIYRDESDPWSIGNADSPRYQRYLELLMPHVRGAVLDIGCGFGALLARLEGKACSLDGVEISATAVEKGRARFPFVTFHQGSAADLDTVASLSGRKFDLIVCSDVIYYLDDRAKYRLLAWINRHLATGGVAFIAAWCPGGKYLTPDELLEISRSELVVTRHESMTESGHLALLCRKRRRLAAITIDYETWHPIPEGKRIDWDKDVFEPTERLFSLFERTSVAATFFAEMGEYFWLVANEPALARRMEEQWRDAVRRGHDVQLHLHPCWLPETGAKREGDNWFWDWSLSKAHDYPGDLTELIGRCKSALENILKPVKPDYAVTSFRAGAYQAQPFERLSKALIANGILCDSSVHPHGLSQERGYDYSTPYTTHQPYFADRFDPQLKALPAEEAIVELPIFTPTRGARWFIDNDGADRFASQLIRHERKHFSPIGISRLRAIRQVRRYAGAIYARTKRQRSVINRCIPRRVAHSLIGFDNPRRSADRYFVAIGHTKADLRYDVLERNFRELATTMDVEFVTISQLARHAAGELAGFRRASGEDEIEYQVKRETTAILGEDRNEPLSYRLQAMIPLDIDRVLDFGCGAGYWSARIAEIYPWVEVVGIDAGADFIAKARQRYASSRVSFEIGDFAKLAHDDASFDCVYADNTLEHSFDLETTLSEIYRVLRNGGSLVAALPIDGMNPDQDCDNHTWKTVTKQVIHRLERAGFSNIHAEEVDGYRVLGLAPYMPSNDRMLYIRAWKVVGGDDPLKRALRAMDWLYRRIDPGKPNLSNRAEQIIADGYGWCAAYAVALGSLLKREGYDLKWVTMRANGHERGTGPQLADTHEVIEVEIDGRRSVLDPMANTRFPLPLDDLLRDPKLADVHANRDARCTERRYDLYNTSYWYEKVNSFSRRPTLRGQRFYWRSNRK